VDARELIRSYNPDTEYVVVNLILGYFSFVECFRLGDIGDGRLRIVDHVQFDYRRFPSPSNDFEEVPPSLIAASASGALDASSFGRNEAKAMPPTATTSIEAHKSIIRFDGYGDELQDLLDYYELGDGKDWAVAHEAWKFAKLRADCFLRGNYRDVINVLEAMRDVDRARSRAHERSAPKHTPSLDLDSYLHARLNGSAPPDDGSLDMRGLLRNSSTTATALRKRAGILVGPDEADCYIDVNKLPHPLDEETGKPVGRAKWARFLGISVSNLKRIKDDGVPVSEYTLGAIAGHSKMEPMDLLDSSKPLPAHLK
jgi:hypothetical protein